MTRLTVLYDERCGFCCRCRDWLARRRQIVALEFVAARSADAAQRFPGLHVDTVEELVVIDDEGGVYRGDEAFLMCLWALEETREWSRRLASPEWRGLARRGFLELSARRQGISRLLGLRDETGDGCADGLCRPGGPIRKA